MFVSIEIMAHLREEEYNWKEKFKSNPKKTSILYYRKNSQIIEIMLRKYYNSETETITLNDWDIKKMLESIVFNFLPNSSSFFKFFECLGFSYKIISFHQDEAPIKTYEFKINLK